ncbi:MAG: UPF0104 family protein [Acidobacteria bacterium]|nr:MAG: UPF0104 family protein [Acidobacteriota bacterium]
MRKRLKFAGTVSLTALIVAVIVWQVEDFGEVWRLMARLAPVYVLLAILLNMLDRGLMAYKWGLLLGGRGIPVPFLFKMKVYCAAMVWGMFLPATVGADTIRILSTSRAGVDVKEVTASVIVERLLGFLASVVCGLASLALLTYSQALDARYQSLWGVSLGLLSLTVLALMASFSDRVYGLVHDRLLGRIAHTGPARKLRYFHDTYRGYRTNRTALWAFFGLTMAEQVVPIFIFWVLALGMGIPVSFLQIAAAVPLAFLVSRLPISAEGVFDGAFMAILAGAGVPPAQSLSITLAGRALQIVAWLPWWAAHVLQTGSLKPPAQAQQSFEVK